ncbi:MAG: CPXCG motif-containing cysteine-rich protein [Gemmatimonadaceae bacterium]|jgi:hypothetical protein|nr:CPXCG motif-containing cysteine-rich protein [Gemmatimonadaceae bacterium]
MPPRTEPFPDDDDDFELDPFGPDADDEPAEDDDADVDEDDDDLDDDPSLDEDFPLGDGTADTTAEVTCPFCAESVEIALDPGSGTVQSYVQDCEVCCNPWQVFVEYDAEGAAHVSVVPTDS